MFIGELLDKGRNHPPDLSHRPGRVHGENKSLRYACVQRGRGDTGDEITKIVSSQINVRLDCPANLRESKTEIAPAMPSEIHGNATGIRM